MLQMKRGERRRERLLFIQTVRRRTITKVCRWRKSADIVAGLIRSQMNRRINVTYSQGVNGIKQIIRWNCWQLYMR